MTKDEWRGSKLPRQVVGATLLGLLAISHQLPAQFSESLVGWTEIGSFRGASSSGIGGKLSDLLFEMENEGDLYQDLGVFSLGIGVGVDDLDLDWDNSFYRRVYPIHREIPAGATLAADDLSGYTDVLTYVMRGRFKWNYLPDVVSGSGVGVEAETGVSMSLVRARTPLQISDRPMNEIFEERRTDDWELMTKQLDPEAKRGFFQKSAYALGQTADWITRGFAANADTERGFLFYDNYSDSLTLLADLGVPVEWSLFLESDPRLRAGDRVRQVTFTGVSPIAASLRKYGFRIQYKNFYRVLRETTLEKLEGNRVAVHVRNRAGFGNEFIPLRFRPEVRLLGIIKIGYTIFEERYDQGLNRSSEFRYVVDLSHPRGIESFKAFIGDGQRVTFRPLAMAALERDGAEVIGEEHRGGSGRAALRRFSLFSPYRYRKRRVVNNDHVTRDGLDYRETVIVLSRSLKDRIGKPQSWTRQFMIQAIGPPELEDDKVSLEGGATNLTTTSEGDGVTGIDVARTAVLLETMFGPHPVLDELRRTPPTEKTRAVFTLQLSFGDDHLRHLTRVHEDELWSEVAAILLGEQHRSEWADAEARSKWKRDSYRQERAASMGSSVMTLPNPTNKNLDVHQRYRLARKTVKKFEKIRKSILEGGCTRCLNSAFRHWKHAMLLQMLLYEIAEDVDPAEPVGYLYEAYSDQLLRPEIVTNGVRYEFEPLRDETEGVTANDLMEEAGKLTGDWLRRDDFTRASTNRIPAGSLWLNTDTSSPPDTPCWRIELLSDLQFDPSIELRVDLRESRGRKADLPFGNRSIAIGPASVADENPFQRARFVYDVPLPDVRLSPDRPYTLLLRLLNSEGFSVSEEQQIRFHWPKNVENDLPPHCTEIPILPSPSAQSDAATEDSTATPSTSP